MMPASFYVFSKKISNTQFMYSIAISSLGFFLFSFQVHEKHILLPLMPITLLYPEISFLSKWFNNIALFSMWPLLKKDQLMLPYIACFILWNTATRESWSVSGSYKRPAIFSYLIMGILHVAEYLIEPPARWPDLYIVLNSIFSAVFFGFFFIILNLHLYFAKPTASSSRISSRGNSKVKIK